MLHFRNPFRQKIHHGDPRRENDNFLMNFVIVLNIYLKDDHLKGFKICKTIFKNYHNEYSNHKPIHISL